MKKEWSNRAIKTWNLSKWRYENRWDRGFKVEGKGKIWTKDDEIWKKSDQIEQLKLEI
jgi:hypothetical protein